MAKKVVVSRATTVLLSVLLSCLTVFPVTEAFWFDIPSGAGYKCVAEDLQANVVVLGNYSVIGELDSEYNFAPVTLRISSPFGNSLHQSNNVSHGEFAFTTKEAGNYLACFTVENQIEAHTKISLGLEWKTGFATKDWNEVAKKEHIEGVELQITKLEELVDQIHNDIFTIIYKESDMRQVSNKTNKKIAWYGLTSLGVCGVTSILQIWRLKRYFVKKRLI